MATAKTTPATDNTAAESTAGPVPALVLIDLPQLGYRCGQSIRLEAGQAARLAAAGQVSLSAAAQALAIPDKTAPRSDVIED